MIQVKLSLEESHIQFLAQCQQYGFKDKSEVVRTALDRLCAEFTLLCGRNCQALLSAFLSFFIPAILL